MRKLLSVLVLGLTLAWAAAPALAGQLAPELTSSDPSDGATVHKAPDRVVLRFSEPLDQSSTAQVKACGRVVDDGDAQVSGNEMTIRVTEAYAGQYVVRYQAVGLGGVTGSSEGSVSFTAHMGEACAGDDGDGHGDHDNHGKGGDDNGGGDHGGHGGDDNDGSGGHHTDDDHGTGTHTGTGTSDQDSTDHSDHDSMGGADEGGTHAERHGGMNHGSRHGGRHGDHGGRITPGNPNGEDHHHPGGGPVAAPPAFGGTAPDGRAVLLALGLSLAVGVLGGAFLRLTA